MTDKNEQICDVADSPGRDWGRVLRLSSANYRQSALGIWDKSSRPNHFDQLEGGKLGQQRECDA